MRILIANTLLSLFAVILLTGTVTPEARGQDKNNPDARTPAVWFKRVLITNDNGVDDPKIRELAQAFSKVAETFVVAPSENRSGSGDHISLGRNPNLAVERRDFGKGINAFAVEGFPADCVAFGLMGLLKNSPPDLVISGINGGPNLAADSYLGSGTIGAARVAAFLGFPAIAVSGLDDDDPDAVAAATRWVVDLANTKIVKELRDKRYLTVSMPRKKPNEIKGVRVTYRAPLVPNVTFKRSPEEGSSSREVWQMQPPKSEGKISPESDVGLFNANYIVIVPMRADELDADRLPFLKDRSEEFPAWPPSNRR